MSLREILDLPDDMALDEFYRLEKMSDDPDQWSAVVEVLAVRNAKTMLTRKRRLTNLCRPNIGVNPDCSEQPFVT